MGRLRHEGLPIGVAFVRTAADVYIGSMLGFGMQFGGSSDLLKRFFQFSFPPMSAMMVTCASFNFHATLVNGFPELIKIAPINGRVSLL